MQAFLESSYEIFLIFYCIVKKLGLLPNCTKFLNLAIENFFKLNLTTIGFSKIFFVKKQVTNNNFSEAPAEKRTHASFENSSGMQQSYNASPYNTSPVVSNMTPDANQQMTPTQFA